jgi:thioredoxin reductase
VGGLDKSVRPFPPGDYDIVVVGSGPGGLQTTYWLRRYGVHSATISADEAPGGMFRRFPIFERLISSSKPDAPCEPGTREYEWYDHNSLVAAEPDHQALVPRLMDRSFVVPMREEMEAGLAAFAERTELAVRYSCRWESTRRDDDGRLVLVTSDGEYRCRAAVFAVGVTEPWKPVVPGIDGVPHYVDTGAPESYQGKTVFILGKRNSAFELATGLLPWARQLVLASPRPVQSSVLALSTVHPRYLQPYADYSMGGGTVVLDAAIERIERRGDGYVVSGGGTKHPGRLELAADRVIAATGFQTPLRDLREIGVSTVNQDRIPSLSAYWESISAPGVFFAGGASQGSGGLRRHGVPSRSTSVVGFRYNARALARRLAGGEPERRALAPDEVVPLLAGELAHGPAVWAQRGYLARAVTLAGDEGPVDDGVVPLAHFVDDEGPDAVAVSVEMDADGRIFPAVYVRRAGNVEVHDLPSDPLNRFDGREYRSALAGLLRLPARSG